MVNRDEDKVRVHMNVVPRSTSYARLSRGIPWNIPRVTCIFWYTHEPLGECVHQENTSTLCLSFVANFSPVSSCFLAVGLEDKRIPDVAFSASSTLTRAHSPSRARLNIQVRNQQAAGWAPGLDDSTPWLQVDLGAKTIITGIGTQGGRYFWWSFGGWVIRFKVSFEISDKGWQIYGKNTSGEVRKLRKRLIKHDKLELSRDLSCWLIRINK